MGFRHVYRPGSPNNTVLFQGCVLENNTHCGKGGQSIPSRMGEVVRSPQWPRFSSRITCGHILSITSSNTTHKAWLGHCTLLRFKSLSEPCPLHSHPLPQLLDQPDLQDGARREGRRQPGKEEVMRWPSPGVGQGQDHTEKRSERQRRGEWVWTGLEPAQRSMGPVWV